MGKSEPAFTCIKTESIANVQRQVNKGSDMPVLVKFLKHSHLLRVLHFTVILLNIMAQFLFYCFVSAYTIKIYFTYRWCIQKTYSEAYSELSKTSKMEIFWSH